MIEIAALWHRASLKHDFPGEIQLLRISAVSEATVPWVFEQFVRRRRMFGSGRVKMISREFVDYVYTQLMHDYSREAHMLKCPVSLSRKSTRSLRFENFCTRD